MAGPGEAVRPEVLTGRRCAGAAREWASQPARGAPQPADDGDGDGGGGGDGAALRPEDMDALLWRSQPAHADDLLLATQEPGGGGAGAGAVCARVVRRLSRLWLRCGEREALCALQAALRQHRYDFRRLDKRTVRNAHPPPPRRRRPARPLRASPQPLAAGDRVRRRAAHARLGVARGGGRRRGAGVPALPRLRAGVQAALRPAARRAAAAGRAAAAAAGRLVCAAAAFARRAHGPVVRRARSATSGPLATVELV